MLESGLVLDESTHRLKPEANSCGIHIWVVWALDMQCKCNNPCRWCVDTLLKEVRRRKRGAGRGAEGE
jgi:hypothetical protein